MKISASIYSQREKPLAEIVAQLSGHGVDMLHIDCRDDPSVFDDIRVIRSLTNIPIDLHIISDSPWKYNAQIEELGIEYVTWQREPLGPGGIDILQIGGTKFGTGIESSTPISIIDPDEGYDYVMLMCTTPGVSGGSFQKENFKRIIEIKNRYPNLKIQVDGGVNDEVGYILRLLGVDSIVSGSFLMNHFSIGSGMLSFYKTPPVGSYQVSDFMTPIEHLPVLKEQDLSFENVLHTIESHRKGFVLIVDEHNNLKGVVSNADLRRGLIRQLDNLVSVDVREMINTDPIRISGDADLGQMLAMINELNFIILFLPVVDSEGKLLGAVLLNNLTRG
ncbi:MAG: CBS domain-containing protein [Bacteroidetes bacterium]|nr:CBS domain-containing protein [Bacteroidota bacterium]